MGDQFKIGFVGTSSAQGNRYAESLLRTLRDVDPAVQIERARTRQDTQDFGASLLLVLGTAAATAVAKGIANWMGRNSGARIEITTDGKVIGTDLDSRDVAKIAEAFSPHHA
jgi:hypothetical protein